MHGEGRRTLGGEALENGRRLRRVRKVVHRRAKRLARAQDVRLGQRHIARAALGEEVAAEERPRRHIQHQPAFPGMGHVGRVVPAHGVAAEREVLAIRERTRRAIGEVVDRHHGGHGSAHRHRLRRGGQEGIERTAFVRLEVRQPDVTQALDRQHRADRLAHQREQLPLARVEEHRRLVDDEVLVEAELARHPGLGNRRVDAVDAVRDLVDVGAGFRVRDHCSTPMKVSRGHMARMCNDRTDRYTSSACRHF